MITILLYIERKFQKTFPTSFAIYVSMLSYQIFTRSQLYFISIVFHVQSLGIRWREKRVYHLQQTIVESKMHRSAYTPISLCASKISDRNRISNNAKFRFLGGVLALLNNSRDTTCREHSRLNIENSRIYPRE